MVAQKFKPTVPIKPEFAQLAQTLPYPQVKEHWHIHFYAEKKLFFLIYWVDHMFPPDTNYQILRNVCTLAINIFGQNIDMGVIYNGMGQFFNKTSPYLCNRPKSSKEESSIYTHLILLQVKDGKTHFFIENVQRFCIRLHHQVFEQENNVSRACLR